MKKTKCLGLLIIALGIFIVNALPANCAILEDNFDLSHTYYDGTNVNVAGTVYDGLFGANHSMKIDANITSPSILTIQLSSNKVTKIDGNHATNGWYAFPMLYKNIAGDFVAEMEFVNPVAKEYVIYLLCCVDLSTSNDFMVGAFPVAADWDFYDYHAAHSNALRTIDSGDGPYITNNLCYKVVRTGDNFQGFSRLNSTSAWLQFIDYDATQPMPETLAVGFSVAEHSDELGLAYEFEKFTITIPEPGLISGLVFMLLLFLRRK